MIADIRRLLDTRPFDPFTIVTSSGQRYFVASHEHAGINPRQTRVTVYFDDDSQVSLSALQLVAIEQNTPVV